MRIKRIFELVLHTVIIIALMMVPLAWVAMVLQVTLGPL